MDIHSRPVVMFRWGVFTLAVAYLVYEIVTADFSRPGGPFRSLTIWALTLSCYSASRMLGLSLGRVTRPHQVTVMCASVLNAMVVYLYWKLFLQDPALVNGNGDIPFLTQYYLHGLGPALQIIDALFIAGAFTRIWRAALPLVGLMVAYVAWAELFVQRFNVTPAGPVTNGLPYPFLNALEAPDRAVFYASNAVVALVVLGVFGIAGQLIARILPKPVAVPK